MRVLLAEDDADLRETTALILRKHGFDVVTAHDGTDAEAKLVTEVVDVALLDVMMPGKDGIALTKLIRSRGDLPVVLLTARDLSSDQVMGLEAGADDYVTKPFDGDVLAARLRAVVRRGATRQETERLGDLEIDRAGMTLTKAGEPVQLSATEFRLLSVLLDHIGAVLSRDQLLDHVWGSSDWGDPRVVDVNIQRLRSKIGADTIATVRGAGYKLVRQ
ncbi:MAG: response regulator transcription factor [Nocardioides sp.]